jgi:putative urate catabolism protein
MKDRHEYPRDVVGYGQVLPEVKWPGNSRIAVQFVLNYEEGAEKSVLHGDVGSETFLAELSNPPSYSARHRSVESVYEYGSRAGVWRILREFEKRGLPLTIFAVSMALERNPDLVAAFLESGHEIACHGWRWINYQEVSELVERQHIELAVAAIERMAGAPPLGWYTGRDSPNTRRLVADQGFFEYDSDSYGDDLPYWCQVERSDGQLVPHLVVPYALDTNDMRFGMSTGFATGNDFYEYLRDAFDVLYAEGSEHPKMLSIGLHCRLIGRPGRFVGLQRFLDYLESKSRVWVCQRIDIARHWRQHHNYSFAD